MTVASRRARTTSASEVVVARSRVTIARRRRRSSSSDAIVVDGWVCRAVDASFWREGVVRLRLGIVLVTPSDRSRDARRVLRPHRARVSILNRARTNLVEQPGAVEDDESAEYGIDVAKRTRVGGGAETKRSKSTGVVWDPIGV